MSIGQVEITAASDGVSSRVVQLLSTMTLEEKLAQLVGFWVDQGD